MQITQSSQSIKAQTSIQVKRLLFVAPEPSTGDSLLIVQTLLEDLALYPSVQVKVISASPLTNVREKGDGFNLEKITPPFHVLLKYIYEISRCDAVLVFTNDLFAIPNASVLLLVARIFHKAVYLNPVGASLDLFIHGQKKMFRKHLLYALRSTDGILTYTRLLKDDLNNLGFTKVYCLPERRPLAPTQCSSSLRVIFLGRIAKLQGPFILLDALKIISEMSDEEIVCDFYGDIHDEIRDEFLNRLKSTPNANYCGVAKAGTGQLIAQYDVLALPATCCESESCPGVLIDAMDAGVPVITTQAHAFSKLITNGINGFLIPTQDSYILAVTIIALAVDPGLRKRMGKANLLKGQQFHTDKFVAQLLKIIFPDLLPAIQRK